MYTMYRSVFMSSDVGASDVAKYMNETVSTLCEEKSVAADSQDRTGGARRGGARRGGQGVEISLASSNSLCASLSIKG